MIPKTCLENGTQSTLPAGGKRCRESGVELFKLISMFMIVVCHVVQTVGWKNTSVPFSDYQIDLLQCTRDPQRLLLPMLLYFGGLGNNGFFLCTAWFLLDSKGARKEKIVRFLTEIWIISVLVFGIVMILRKGQMPGSMILKQFFPTLFANTWYLTCYLVFYALHPFLNSIIRRLDQRGLLRVTAVLLLLYSVLDMCNGVIDRVINTTITFYSSNLIIWVMFYFFVAYMKTCILPGKSKHTRLNLWMIVIGALGIFVPVLLINEVGLRVKLFQDQLLVWDRVANPFKLLLSFGLFNLFREIKFTNKTINYLASMTMYIFLFHENLLLRTYYRPILWQLVYTKFGYRYILGWALVLTVIVFLFGVAASILYKHTLHRAALRLSDWLYRRLSKLWRGAEDRILAWNQRQDIKTDKEPTEPE